MTGLSSAVGGVFHKRLRGFRVIDLCALALLIVLVLGVYAFKAAAGREGGRVQDADQSIAEETRAIRLLRAEVARLEQPERLERLSGGYLGLQAENPRREIDAQALPLVIRASDPAPAPAPVPAQAALAAPAAPR